MATSSPIDVAYGTDWRYVPGLAVSIASIAANLAPGRAVNVHVLHSELSDDQLASLSEWRPAEQVRLHLVELPSGMFASLPRRGGDIAHGARANFFRLAIPKVLPGVERVLYLDSDTIVEGDIAELWATPLGSSYVAAVHDPAIPYFGHHDAFADPVALGLSRGTPYFNSGVMIMNLAAWRRDGVSDRAVEYLAANAEHLRHLDQEALNYLVRGSFVRLPTAWNVLNCGLDPEFLPGTEIDVTRETKLHHYAGAWAPWLGNYPFQLVCDRFDHYARRVPCTLSAPPTGAR